MLCTQVAIPELDNATEGLPPLETSVPEAQEVASAASSPEQAGAALALGGPSKGNSARSGSRAKAGAAAVQRGRKQAGAQQLSAGTAGAAPAPAPAAGAGAAPAEVPRRAALQRAGPDPVAAAGANSWTTGDCKAPSAAPHEQLLSALAPAAAGAEEACALGKLAGRSAPDQGFRCTNTAYLLGHLVAACKRQPCCRSSSIGLRWATAHLLDLFSCPQANGVCTASRLSLCNHSFTVSGSSWQPMAVAPAVSGLAGPSAQQLASQFPKPVAPALQERCQSS